MDYQEFILVFCPVQDPRSKSLQFSHGSLPRNTRISVPPDVSSPVHSPYHLQPIISRISIPPTSTPPRQRRPIPLSVIMRLQNPHWEAMSTRNPRVLGIEGDVAPYQPAVRIPREFSNQPVHLPHQQPPELRQPAIYSDGITFHICTHPLTLCAHRIFVHLTLHYKCGLVSIVAVLNPGDIDAELERLDFVHHMPVISEKPSITPAPRPLSPTRLQPVVAPEAQSQEIPDLEELLRIRAEIPRALKRRGSVDQSRPLKKASHYQPNQYKNLIDKLFRRKEHRQKGEQGSETSSSSDGEDSAMPPPPVPQTSLIPHDFRVRNGFTAVDDIIISEESEMCQILLKLPLNWLKTC